MSQCRWHNMKAWKNCLHSNIYFNVLLTRPCSLQDVVATNLSMKPFPSSPRYLIPFYMIADQFASTILSKFWHPQSNRIKILENAGKSSQKAIFRRSPQIHSMAGVFHIAPYI